MMSVHGEVKREKSRKGNNVKNGVRTLHTE